MVGAPFDGIEVVLGVVPFVEDDRDVLGPIGHEPVASDDLLDEAAERRRVRLVAGVCPVHQRYMEVGGDQQGETDDPKSRAAVLALAALSERGAFVEGVDEGEEIRGVEEDSLQIDVELAHHVRHEVSLDGDDRIVRHPVHVVPKALAGELPRLDVQQSA